MSKQSVRIPKIEDNNYNFVELMGKLCNVKTDSHKFTFIDLFAEIGGFHIAANKMKDKCVFACKIVKTSDFGLPQHRSRLFMVGLRNQKTFHLPNNIPLKKIMSDILKGNCNKRIGFTLRVGDRESKINDRRNWDCYLVDGKERKLNYKEAMQMQDFPQYFIFNVSEHKQ